MSVTRDFIAALSKGACSSLLVPAGFRRSAPHFWREVDGINHAVNFQASAWGSRDSGAFTINLGVSTVALHAAFTGQKFPTNRGTALWPINVRLGLLRPSRTDLWWKLTAASDSSAIEESVVAALRDYGLPFFELMRTSDQLAHCAREPGPGGVFRAQLPLVLATMAIERGDSSEARSLLSAALAENRGKPFEPTIREVAGRLGVSVDA